MSFLILVLEFIIKMFQQFDYYYFLGNNKFIDFILNDDRLLREL